MIKKHEITPFNFKGHNARVITDESGEPLFVGKDVCEALGYANDSDAMKRHCKGVVKRYPLQTAGGMQEVRVLTDPDVMRLMVNSTLPSAESLELLPVITS
jgi:prophage antirepressor-like protein